MFRYNKSEEKDDVKMEDYVLGWKETDFLNTLKLSKDRTFTIKSGDIEVEIDIHFFQSMMRSFNASGDLKMGLKKINQHPQLAKVNVETAKPMFTFLRKHHEASTNWKLPAGSLDFLMLLIASAPFMYEEITDFQNDNSEEVLEALLEKIQFREGIIKSEYEEQIDSLTEKLERNLEHIQDHFKNTAETARKAGHVQVADRMEQEIIPKRLAAVYEEYGVNTDSAMEMKEKRLAHVSDTTFVTYSFLVGEYDVLVAKTGDKKLRLRTMYFMKEVQEPINAFLYILDYGQR